MEIVLLVVIIIGFIVIGYILIRKKDTPSELLEVIKILERGSHENTRSLNERLDNASRVIADVQKNLGEIGEIGRSMKDLQEFLKSPKIRGNVGESILRELLTQMLPKDAFYLQYTFRSGEKVDAAVKTSAGIIPIDSKFPMENFRKILNATTNEDKAFYDKAFVRDIKTHIDAISKKYILTEEGTIDYALMYIPSEAVYYEIVNNPDLFEYAGKKGVLPVSPTTFYAYMRAILMSFDGQKIEKKAREILSSIKAIQKDYEKVESNLSILQKHMTNAFNMLNSFSTGFLELGQKIARSKNFEIEENSEEKKRLDDI